MCPKQVANCCCSEDAQRTSVLEVMYLDRTVAECGLGSRPVPTLIIAGGGNARSFVT